MMRYCLEVDLRVTLHVASLTLGRRSMLKLWEKELRRARAMIKRDGMGSHVPAGYAGLTLSGQSNAGMPPLGRFHLISISTTLLISYPSLVLIMSEHNDVW